MFKIKTIVIIATLFSGSVTFGIYRYMQKSKEKLQDPLRDYQKVVVAKVDLPMGTEIRLMDLSVSDWPKKVAPKGCYSDPANIVGRVVKTEVYTGEAFLESKLAPEGSVGGFSSIIPLGMRALTVSVNSFSGVGGFVLPNTRVDVLVTVPSPLRKEESKTKIILEDIQVLAVDQTFERKGDDPVTVQTVTLLVTPQQAEKLVLASTEGKLQLSLRNTADRSVNVTSGARLKELIAKKNRVISRRPTKATVPKTAQVNAGKQKNVVEIINSDQRIEVVFENGERKESKKLSR
jgi:pilus assembly protein CpaB